MNFVECESNLNDLISEYFSCPLDDYEGYEGEESEEEKTDHDDLELWIIIFLFIYVKLINKFTSKKGVSWNSIIFYFSNN